LERGIAGGPRSDKQVGIKDVAAAAGVSITTVSHALNGKGRLPDATRAHVRAIADRLGYRASPTAQHFAAGRSGLIALTLSDEIVSTVALADFSFYAQIMVAAAERALERGYALVLAVSRAREWLRAQPDAVFGLDPVVGDRVWDEMEAAGVPHATLGRPLDRESSAWVDNDHRATARLAFEHLRDRGAGRIAMIGTGLDISVERDIQEAYEQWCADQGHAPRIATTGRDLSPTGGFDALTRLLSKRYPPDAIYATVDTLAMGAAMAARARELTIPDRLMIVSCGDSEATRSSHPPLSAMDLAPAQIAASGIDMLVEAIETQAAPREPTLVPTRLIERESTSRPRSEPAAAAKSRRRRSTSVV